MLVALGAMLVSAGLASLLNHIELIPWRRASKDHWTERARKLYPARVSRKVNIWVIPVVITLGCGLLFPGRPWLLMLVMAFVGTAVGSYPMDRETSSGLSFSKWAHQMAGHWFLLFLRASLLALAAFAMPSEPGWTMLLIAGFYFALHFALQFGIGIRLMRWLKILVPASPRLRSLVDETSKSMAVPVAATWEMVGAAPNAFAFVTTRELAFTEGLLENCPDDEIKAICAHEIAHLAESRWVLAVRLLGSLRYAPVIFLWYALEQPRGIGVAILFVLIAAIWLGNVTLARAMETRADKVARESIDDASTFARAVERLHRVAEMPAVLRHEESPTHPNLYDRMVAAGVTPDYPRPEAPDRGGVSGTIMITVGALIVMILLAPFLR